MTTWLVFLRKGPQGAREDFVLPVTAPTRADALKAVASAYPATDFQLLTCYAETELQRILAETQAWQDGLAAPSADAAVAAAPAVADTVQAPSGAVPMVAPVAAPPRTLTSVRKQSLEKKRAAAASVAENGAPVRVAEPLPVELAPAAAPVGAAVTAPSAAPTMPQDLKTMLALLKAAAAASKAAPAPLEGRVEVRADAPVASVPLGTVFESRALSSPAPSPAISRRPSAEALPAVPARSMADVLKSLRK